MRWRAFHCAALSASLLVSARAADPGPGSVMVESNLARKTEPAAQEDRIWSEVILATNSATPKPSPPELVDAEPMLKRVFGYNQFEVVGRCTEVIDTVHEHWLTPGKNFSLSVSAHRAAGQELQHFRGGYALSLQIFQQKRSLVKTEARIAPGIPLWFRGPECGKGLIIFVIKVLEAKH